MGAKKWRDLVAGLVIFTLFLFLLNAVCMQKPKHDDTPAFTEENIIKSILGEARGEGDAAMYAIASAIRNRGTLKGVYGFNAKMEDISPELWQRADRAWWTSEWEGDTVHGGTHWLSDYDREHCKSWRVWIADYKAVARVGTTTFYKRRK